MNVAYWDGALRKEHTLHIVSFISHRPGRKGTLASDLKGAGLEGFKLWSMIFCVLFLGPIRNISVLSEFNRRKWMVIQHTETSQPVCAYFMNSMNWISLLAEHK